MQIIGQYPDDWRQLQHFVCDVLRDCGYDASVEKKINTVRSSVVIDVYATKEQGYKSLVICECKQWNNKIPQTAVHAFRTVMQDSGASQGFIISKLGFQSGAYDSAANTNVQLLTWNDFLTRFEAEYFKEVINRNEMIGNELRAFGTYLISKGVKDFRDLYTSNECEFLSLRDLYTDYIFYSRKEHFINLVTNQVDKNEINRAISYSETHYVSVKFTSYKDYFDYIYKNCIEAINNVEKIFKDKIIWNRIKLHEKGY